MGIDRIKELWDSNSEGHLLQFLCSIAKDYEPRNNLFQFLLVGPKAFHVLHPKNVESILSTNFTREPSRSRNQNKTSNLVMQNTTLESVEISSLLYSGTLSLHKKVRLGNTRGSFYESSLYKHSIRTWTTFASMSTISLLTCHLKVSSIFSLCSLISL